MIWPTGHTLQNGKYEILDVLGQGGFGITYRALHVRLQSTVVVKTPNEYLQHDPDYDKYIARFIQEGRLLARLEPHPHIVQARDLFQEGDTYCLVMDYVDGENLFQMVKRRGAIPEAEAVLWIQQIGEALSFLHQNKLVHRDAHPGNIIIRKNGKAVLIDFGIAKELVPTTQSSMGNMGNQGFAPYEQLSKGNREPCVDVYCLAASLYFAVTGQRPEASLARKLNNTHLLPPNQIKRALGTYVNQAILAGMALEASDRPQSMAQWLASLSAPQQASLINQTFARVPKRPNFSGNRKKPRIRKIPWLWLSIIFGLYGLQGYFTIVAGGGAWALTCSLAWALAWALAWFFAATGIVDVTGALAVTVTLAGALAGAWATVVAGAVTGAVVVAGAGAGATAVAAAVVVAVAGAATLVKLEQFCRPWQMFWILWGTAALGLLAGALFR